MATVNITNTQCVYAGKYPCIEQALLLDVTFNPTRTTSEDGLKAVKVLADLLRTGFKQTVVPYHAYDVNAYVSNQSQTQ